MSVRSFHYDSHFTKVTQSKRVGQPHSEHSKLSTSVDSMSHLRMVDFTSMEEPSPSVESLTSDCQYSKFLFVADDRVADGGVTDVDGVHSSTLC